MGGWRGLAVFWAAILVICIGGIVVLQSLGPPEAPAPVAVSPPPAAIAPAAPSPAPVAQPSPVPAGLPPGRSTAGPIDDPDPALQEPARAGDGAMLPRRDASGRGPMQAYARGFDATTLRPRIGLILAGIGASDPDSQEAIRTLPGAVTLAVSPYTPQPYRLLEAARIAGHEYLLSLAMESPGDAGGDHALLTGAPAQQNADRLDWLLSRFSGYAGVTDALGTLHGDRFAGNAALMAPLLQAVVARGLFFIDARPNAPPPPGVWTASVDVVVDEPAVRSEIDARLAQLETLARQRGSALGLAGAPRAITIARLAEWANGLAAKGFVLAPASALVRLQPTAATSTGTTK